jgi:hypothetical protein
MNIIEKLEEIISNSELKQHIQVVIKTHDLRAIIEEYKATEQEAFGYVGEITYNGARSGTVNKNKTVHFKYPLFTHPQLSDETVKDAARYRWLLKNYQIEEDDGFLSLRFDTCRPANMHPLGLREFWINEDIGAAMREKKSNEGKL